MEIYIRCGVIIVMGFNNIPLSGWKCYLKEKHPIVRTVSINVSLFKIWLIKGAMRESRGKRSLKIGTLLPNIVLYNDPTPHPSTETTAKVISADLSRKPDLMIVFGTSLKVHGIKKLVKNFAKTIHSNKGIVVFVNKNELGKSEWGNVFDYWVQGDCDAWVHDLKLRIPNLWMKQEPLPIMPIIKPVSKKGTFILVIILTLASKVVVIVDDKENQIPSTPKKAVKSTTSQTTIVSRSPLSPTKRGINHDAPESPTKRLQTSLGSMNLSVGGTDT
jgi:hypothetical protein